jgi:tetratricopeptide (TPR) repeat protein
VRLAIETQEKMPAMGEKYSSFAHGLLAENYRRRAVYDETAREKWLNAADRSHETLIATHRHGLENTWGQLRLADLLGSRGMWPRAMRSFHDALRGKELQAPEELVLVVDGIALIGQQQLPQTIEVLQELLSIRVDKDNVIATLLFADALGRIGRHDQAIAVLSKVEGALGCEATVIRMVKGEPADDGLRGCENLPGVWLGPEMRVRTTATRAKVLARSGRTHDAAAVIRSLESGIDRGAGEMLSWDLAEASVAIGDDGLTKRYCQAIRQVSPATLAAAKRLRLAVGLKCSK